MKRVSAFDRILWAIVHHYSFFFTQQVEKKGGNNVDPSILINQLLVILFFMDTHTERKCKDHWGMNMKLRKVVPGMQWVRFSAITTFLSG